MKPVDMVDGAKLVERVLSKPTSALGLVMCVSYAVLL